MANDTWRTPPEVFAYYNSIYNFQVDVCASKENALCKNYITEAEDYLSYNFIYPDHTGCYVWQNPPYSNPLPFVQKAIADSQLYGIGCVLLLNHDMSTKWAWNLCNHEIKHEVFIGKRISFLNSEGVPVKGNSKGQFVAIIPPFVRAGFASVEYLPLKMVMRKGSAVIRAIEIQNKKVAA